MNSRQLVSLINLAMNCKCSRTVVIGNFNFPTSDWNDWSTSHDINHSEYLFLEFLAPSNQQAYEVSFWPISKHFGPLNIG